VVQPTSHPNIITNSTSTFAPRYNSTNIHSILDAITAVNAHKAGDKPLYRQTAKSFGVDRTTLARRHQGKTRSHAGEAQQRMLLSPQQEKQLVGYIEKLEKRGLPPTREMIRNFASVVAK
jgi:hypothetical protein